MVGVVHSQILVNPEIVMFSGNAPYQAMRSDQYFLAILLMTRNLV
jgi:hypothetical protein